MDPTTDPFLQLREIIDAGNEIEKVDKPPKKRGRGTTGKPKGRPPGAKNKPKPEDDGLPKVSDTRFEPVVFFFPSLFSKTSILTHTLLGAQEEGETPRGEEQAKG